MKKNLAVTAIAALLLLLSTRGTSQDKWGQAEREIKRIPPSVFTELPTAVVKQLQVQGCMIPQVFDASTPHNVIRGQFAKKGQDDWAVLCSKNGKSSILVFWAKPSQCSTGLAPAEDRSFLQEVGEGKMGYSRVIAAVDQAYLQEHYKRYAGPKLPPLDHQGINDAFVAKASVVHYCDGRKWLRLTGAD